jgi:5-methylcytosine-specific restriction endonuclease McrA
MYKTAQWKTLRLRQLARHPYCQCPIHKGKDKSALADTVDHHRAHKGDRRLFFDPANLRSMTKHCHDSLKQQVEKSGGFSGCDADGLPLDPNHAWNQR